MEARLQPLVALAKLRGSDLLGLAEAATEAPRAAPWMLRAGGALNSGLSYALL
jgi:hypothetical protein